MFSFAGLCSVFCLLIVAAAPVLVVRYCAARHISIATFIYRKPLLPVGAMLILYDLLPVSLLRLASTSGSGSGSKYLESIYCVTIVYCFLTVILVLIGMVIYSHAAPSEVAIVTNVLEVCIAIAVVLLLYYSLHLLEAYDPSGLSKAVEFLFE